MIEGQEDTEELEALPLEELLARDDLCLEEVLSVRGIHGRLKQELPAFLEHCARNDSFADRLITLGLKCPMHQSDSPQMKALTFIAADLLTADCDALADFLLPLPHPEDGAIAEEIEAEEGSPSESERYRWVGRVVEYLQGEELDENCVNYVARSLLVLVRRRLGALLEYLRACPDVLARLAHLAHYPAIAQLLAKLVTDEDDHMPQPARVARQMVVPLLLQKLHSDHALPGALEVVDCLDQILQASRSDDPNAPSELQRLSDIIVSAEEVEFQLSALLPTPSPAALTAVCYLGVAVGRMNQDEWQEGGYALPFAPTLHYQLDALFAAYCRLAAAGVRVEGGQRLLGVRWLELLVAMGRHSRFAAFYELIAREERVQALQALVWSVARGNMTGLLLQLACSVVETAVGQEERIACSTADPAVKLSPGALYAVLSDHQLHLRELVEGLASEGPRQRNCNQHGVFLRKLLVVLDNFFSNSQIHRHFPDAHSVTTLFPTFTSESCRQYAQGAAILNHPNGQRARLPQEFGFIRRQQQALESQSLKVTPSELPPPSPEEPKKQPEIVFKLTQKIRTLKDRVREKQQRTNPPEEAKQLSQEEERKEEKETEKEKEKEKEKGNEEAKEEQKEVERPPSPKKLACVLVERAGCCKSGEVGCVRFFVRHLPIY